MNVTYYKNKKLGFDCIDLIKNLSFPEGSIIKYLWRAGKKNTDEREDLKKALDYLHLLFDKENIQREEGKILPQSWKDLQIFIGNTSFTPVQFIGAKKTPADLALMHFVASLRYKAEKQWFYAKTIQILTAATKD